MISRLLLLIFVIPTEANPEAPKPLCEEVINDALLLDNFDENLILAQADFILQESLLTVYNCFADLDKKKLTEDSIKTTMDYLLHKVEKVSKKVKTLSTPNVAKKLVQDIKTIVKEIFGEKDVKFEKQETLDEAFEEIYRQPVYVEFSEEDLDLINRALMKIMPEFEGAITDDLIAKITNYLRKKLDPFNAKVEFFNRLEAEEELVAIVEKELGTCSIWSEVFEEWFRHFSIKKKNKKRDIKDNIKELKKLLTSCLNRFTASENYDADTRAEIMSKVMTLFDDYLAKRIPSAFEDDFKGVKKSFQTFVSELLVTPKSKEAITRERVKAWVKEMSDY